MIIVLVTRNFVPMFALPCSLRLAIASETFVRWQEWTEEIFFTCPWFVIPFCFIFWARMTIYRTRPWLGNRQDSQNMSPYEPVIFWRSMLTRVYRESFLWWPPDSDVYGWLHSILSIKWIWTDRRVPYPDISDTWRDSSSGWNHGVASELRGSNSKSRGYYHPNPAVFSPSVLGRLNFMRSPWNKSMNRKHRKLAQ